MIAEILIIILIIIVLLVFLLFFKSWHLYLVFKNYNSDYNLSLIIKYLIFQIDVEKTESIKIIINLNIKDKLVKLFDVVLNSKKEQKDNQEQKDDKEQTDEHKDYFVKIKKIIPLILESKKELYDIVLLLVSIVTFKHSRVVLNLGLGDNNLTIKLCSLLWSLSAPLYPLNFQLILTPEINKSIIKSDAVINLDIKLFNILRILYIIISSKKLMEIIKVLR